MKYYDGVLQRVRKIEDKNAISYAKPGGKLYNVIRVIYIVALVYGMLNATAYLLGMLVRYSEHLKDFMADIIPVAVSLLILVAGLVCLLKRWHIAGAVLTVIPSAVFIFFFRDKLVDELTINGVHLKYYWRHFAPMLIVIILVVWMLIIALRAELKTKKQYIRVTENLYNLYKVNVTDGEEISEEQWDEFLKRYDPLQYKPQFLANIEKENGNEE